MSRFSGKRGLGLLVVLAVLFIAAALIYVYRDSDAKPSDFLLARVERGSIVSTVSSTGTLNAVVTVLVGSQVSGQIKALQADFNSEVRQGQIIALIDPENFEARVRQAEAELAVASANVAIQRAAVERARADLQNARASLVAAKAQTEKARVALEDAKRDLDRKQTLHQSSIISKSETDDAMANHDQALAQLSTAKAQEEAQASLVGSREAAHKMAKAQVHHAAAQVKHREAALRQSKVDFEHTIIRSPVDGVVIERSVDVGQTVAASLQAPTLFTIAQDLRKMQVDASLDEADIGRIRVGHQATFTVDAFAGREFGGRVEQIRKAPKTIQNVVTYTVVVSADNADLRLLPGMTANVQIVVNQRSDILRVPNAALRFQPSSPDGGLPGGPRGSQSAGLSRGGRPDSKMLERLAEALGLNETQRSQLQAIFEQGRERIVALRRQGVTPEEIRAEIQAMRERSQGRILEILTPEQREKYRRMADSRATHPVKRERVWTVSENGKPRPIEVITGISDGSFTEIIRGDIEAGQQLIVGINQPRRRSRIRGSRRLGF